MPATRGTVQSGAYRWVRHPIYLAELGMVTACVVAAQRSIAWLAWSATVALVSLRIVIEEKLLQNRDDYHAYCARVRWRLLPGVW
jgi:protein-S-isoprenylcysteine O-methyltransferase Ste14